MRFQRIIHAVYFQPWLITQGGHASIAHLLQSKLAGKIEDRKQGIVGFSKVPFYNYNTTTGTYDAFTTSTGTVAGSHLGFDMTDMMGDEPQMSIENGIAEIPVQGVIGKGLSVIEKSCGAVGTEDVQANIETALANQSVKGILFNIDSPGGTVSGVPELADMISAVSEKMPTVAFTDGMMASAAYWIGSGAREIYASKTGEVGSIGVYLPWVDQTAAYAAEGMKVDLIKNTGGDYKGMGYPGTALTADQRAELQRSIDQIFSMFSGFVKTQRGNNLNDQSLKGQTFLGNEAHDMGLTDGTGSYEDALQALQNQIARV